jgi:hypothetical protein
VAEISHGILVIRGCKPHKDTCNFGHLLDLLVFMTRNPETTGLEYEISREVNQAQDSNATSQASKQHATFSLNVRRDYRLGRDRLENINSLHGILLTRTRHRVFNNFFGKRLRSSSG